MKRIASIAILLILASVQFGQLIQTRVGLSSSEVHELYSFESDLEGWRINGSGLSPDQPDADVWSITRSQDMATDGLTSVKFDLINNNDQGMIWIEKAFQVEPNRLYEVNVSYSFATASGFIGSFDIITGALKRRPSMGRDLIPAIRESADKGNSKSGFTWLDKHYEFAVSSAQADSLWIVIGIWGTFETGGTYYVDSVRVDITPKPEGSQFYSFETDMEGWSANATDVAAGDWTNSISPDLWDDGAASLQLALNNQSGKGKVWIERAFAVEPGSKYRLSLDYAFSSKNSNPRYFQIIAGVFRYPPLTADDLSSAYQDDPTPLSVWVHKSYEFAIKSKKSSTLYLVIGVLATELKYQEYFVDSVCVTLTKR